VTDPLLTSGEIFDIIYSQVNNKGRIYMANSARNIKAERQRLDREVKGCKTRIADELTDYKYALGELRSALKSYKAAYAKYTKKPSEKNRGAMNIAYKQLEGEYAAAYAVKERIISYLDAAAEATAEHRDLLGTNDRAGMRLADGFESFSVGITSRLSVLERGIYDEVPDEIRGGADEIEEQEDYATSVANDLKEMSRPAEQKSITAAELKIIIDSAVRSAVSSLGKELKAMIMEERELSAEREERLLAKITELIGAQSDAFTAPVEEETEIAIAPDTSDAAVVEPECEADDPEQSEESDAVDIKNEAEQ